MLFQNLEECIEFFFLNWHLCQLKKVNWIIFRQKMKNYAIADHSIAELQNGSTFNLPLKGIT